MMNERLESPTPGISDDCPSIEILDHLCHLSQFLNEYFTVKPKIAATNDIKQRV